MPFEHTYTSTAPNMPTLTVPNNSAACVFDKTPFTEVPIAVPRPFGSSMISGFRVRWAGLACCFVTYRVCIYTDRFEKALAGVSCTSPPDDPCLTASFNIGSNSPTFVFRSGCGTAFRVSSGTGFETWGEEILNIRLRVLGISPANPSCGTDQETKIKFCVDATEDTSAPASWTTVVP